MVNKAEIDVFLELSCFFDDPGVAAERSNPTSKERWLHGHRRAESSYSTFKVRRGDLIQGKEQWPQDWKRAVFIPIPKKGNAKECSNYHTIALISHTSKVMLKILQARLQQ